jgi:hypothetical protein
MFFFNFPEKFFEKNFNGGFGLVWQYKKRGFKANGGFGTEQIYIEKKRNAGGKAEQWI